MDDSLNFQQDAHDCFEIEDFLYKFELEDGIMKYAPPNFQKFCTEVNIDECLSYLSQVHNCQSSHLKLFLNCIIFATNFVVFNILNYPFFRN